MLIFDLQRCFPLSFVLVVHVATQALARLQYRRAVVAGKAGMLGHVERLDVPGHVCLQPSEFLRDGRGGGGVGL